MGIYDKGINFDYKFSYEKIKTPLIALGGIIIIAIIVLLILSVLSLFQPKAIELQFEKNPIKANEQTYLIATITNVTEIDATNVKVEVKARDESSISVSPPGTMIQVLEKGKGKRILRFLLNPVGDVSPGDYVIDISVTINGQIYKEETVLKITS